MTKKNFEHLGGGRFDVFREKPKKPLADKIGDVIGVAMLVGVGLIILNAVFG